MTGPQLASVRSLAAHAAYPLTSALTSAEFKELRLERRHWVFRRGHAFRALYEVQFGCVKTIESREDGHEQVTGFYVPGELLGLDAIDSGEYQCDARAIVGTHLRVIPSSELARLSSASARFQRQLHRMLSLEITRSHRTMLILGTLLAEQRLAAFLLDLAQRLRPRGDAAPPSTLSMDMTRVDIGSYLGTTIETVSRAFGSLQDHGLIHLDKRVVRILHRSGLEQFANGVDEFLSAASRVR